jgi:hypothetical protein
MANIRTWEISGAIVLILIGIAMIVLPILL